jgi:hypothetical protein
MPQPGDDKDMDPKQQAEQSPRARENAAQPNPEGQPSPGLKDKDAVTSDSYGDTRDSGDPASR